MNSLRYKHITNTSYLRQGAPEFEQMSEKLACRWNKAFVIGGLKTVLLSLINFISPSNLYLITTLFFTMYTVVIFIKYKYGNIHRLQD